ncbi:hypothetical protein WDL1CHR_06411 [Variovorax sp. WDL1]|nr:hypothetical protein CHC07_04871 [Variovorax sp. B4]PNG55038.1 hypothetical protein CHC06_03837 [Variovorax sp. B2]VTV16064.1 hypothetical protein WDL1CHR_06411 [Variovorax sp. WDL1]
MQDFLNRAGDESSIHAKVGKDGSRVLYVSKGKGTGFKRALFPEQFKARRIAARQAILKITNASPEQNDALYNSIKSGFMQIELDGSNFAVDAAPLIVSDLKSMLSAQIELHEEALAEEYFKGVELDFGTGKAQTPFSPRNENSTPLAKGLQDAMEGIRDSAHQLSGSERKTLRNNTAAFIRDNMPNCPFNASHEYEEIIDFSLNFDRNINRLLKEVFDGPPKIKGLEEATAGLADNFNKLKFTVTLLTSTEFIESCPEEKRKGMRKLGEQLSALHKLLNQPKGFYTSLGALTGLAINSPADFRNYLNKFKSNFI